MTKPLSRAGKLVVGLLVAAMLGIIALEVSGLWVPPTVGFARQRAEAFAHEINYNYQNPAAAYPYLTEQYRTQFSEAAFVEAFHKERSYPYLSPLFINFERLEMAPGGLSGTAYFSQAARLPGMIFELPLIYENGNYYVVAFEEFLDGSYLDKFDRL